jgi:hypothetical protein
LKQGVEAMAKMTVDVPDIPGWIPEEATVLPFDESVSSLPQAKSRSLMTRIRVYFVKEEGNWEPATELHVSRLIRVGNLCRARFRNHNEIDWREGRLLGFEYTNHGQKFWISEFGRFPICEVWRT